MWFMAKAKDQFLRTYARLERVVPSRVGRALHWLHEPRARPVRLPISILCIAGGCLSFLPVLGPELFPIGLMLLAHDVPLLRRPASGLTTWLLNWYERACRLWAACRKALMAAVPQSAHAGEREQCWGESPKERAMPKQYACIPMAAVACGLAAAPVAAHHGWAAQGAEQIEVTGKVHKPVRLAGPHATMQVIADGKVWDVTLAPSARTEGAGLTPETFAVGDQVTVRGNRNNDPERFEIKTVRVSSGGRNYDVYPDRIR